jgi:hypothetical protein
MTLAVGKDKITAVETIKKHDKLLAYESFLLF